MKKMIISIICLILFLASLAWEQEKVEAPVINVGSKWTYRTDTGRERMTEYIGEEEDLYIFLTTGTFNYPNSEGERKSEWKRYYNKKNMNCVKVFRDGKEEKKDKDIFRKQFDFPLYLGKKWNDQFTIVNSMGKNKGQSLNMVSEFSVIGFEDVNVMSGKFRAIKIRNEMTPMGACHCMSIGFRTHRIWYSPDVKAIIKWEVDPFGYHVGYKYMKYELVSFELK